jgi:hypothetical protein
VGNGDPTLLAMACSPQWQELGPLYNRQKRAWIVAIYPEEHSYGLILTHVIGDATIQTPKGCIYGNADRCTVYAVRGRKVQILVYHNVHSETTDRYCHTDTQGGLYSTETA